MNHARVASTLCSKTVFSVFTPRANLAWSSRIGCSSPASSVSSSISNAPNVAPTNSFRRRVVSSSSTALARLTVLTNCSPSSTSSGTSSVWNGQYSRPSSASCGHSHTSCSSPSGGLESSTHSSGSSPCQFGGSCLRATYLHVLPPSVISVLLSAPKS